MRSDKPRVIVIAGPTASMKSSAAVDIAIYTGGEVISADSMQVYRGMDIGTAKIRPSERKGVAHHLIDVMDIDEDLSAATYKEMGDEALGGILSRGAVPVIAGGTGYYIQSLIYDIDFGLCSADTPRLRRELEDCSGEELAGMLLSEDPLAGDIDISNKRRIINALIYRRQTGESIAVHNKREAHKKLDPPYDILFFVLCSDRKSMYERIEKRVDSMMEEGLLAEVEGLVGRGLSPSHTAGQAIGYKELMEAIAGDKSIDEAVSLIKLHTRRYAKRQLTWFRREKSAVWIDIEKEDPSDAIIRYIH